MVFLHVSFTCFFSSNLLINLKMKICGLFFNISSTSFPSSFPLFFFFFGWDYGLICHKSLQYPPDCIFDELTIQKHCSVLPSGNNLSPGFPERMPLHAHSLEKSENYTILPMLRRCWVLKTATGKILYSMEKHIRNNFLKRLLNSYRLHMYKK